MTIDSFKSRGPGDGRAVTLSDDGRVVTRTAATATIVRKKPTPQSPEDKTNNSAKEGNDSVPNKEKR